MRGLAGMIDLRQSLLQLVDGIDRRLAQREDPREVLEGVQGELGALALCAPSVMSLRDHVEADHAVLAQVADVADYLAKHARVGNDEPFVMLTAAQRLRRALYGDES